MSLNVVAGFLYISFSAISLIINAPILTLIALSYQLRTKYPTVLGSLIVDNICLLCLLATGFLLLHLHDDCIPKIIATSLPILQSVYILCTSVDYIIARFRPLFFHSPPRLYRAFVFGITIAVSLTILLISFQEEGLFDVAIVQERLWHDCPTQHGLVFVYTVCIVFASISLIFHVILFTSLQDFHLKYAITIRSFLISSFILTPSFIVVVLLLSSNHETAKTGIIISNVLVTVEVFFNGLLQFRNHDFKNYCRNLIRIRRVQS